MQEDLTELLGERGSRQGFPGGFNGGPAPNVEAGELPPDGQGGGFPGGGRGFGGDMTPVNPIWVPATVEFDGRTWTDVGVRYKGNSSLRSAWNDGTLKLPFKFDFDEFEGDVPEIKNQRFYGFKQLSFANGFGDATYLREKIMYDLFGEAGLVASNTAYYVLSLDYGEGVKRLGLYTAVEVTDDTVVDRVFGDDSGNIYEADGPAASFAQGTAEQIENSFQKENNEDAADWSDLEKLYNVLHSTERTTNPEAWRAQLDAVFDTDTFLKWLALSALAQHWDTYGAMTHNYYLYHDPATDLLTWISWDHNLTLGGMGGFRGGGFGGQGGANGGQPPNGGFGGGPGGRSQVTFDKANVGANWPLIRFLMDDPTYHARYVSELKTLRSSIFDPVALQAKYQALADWLESVAILESSQPAYESAVQQLDVQVRGTRELADEFLAKNP